MIGTLAKQALRRENMRCHHLDRRQGYGAAGQSAGHADQHDDQRDARRSRGAREVRRAARAHRRLPDAGRRRVDNMPGVDKVRAEDGGEMAHPVRLARQACRCTPTKSAARSARTCARRWTGCRRRASCSAIKCDVAIAHDALHDACAATAGHGEAGRALRALGVQDLAARTDAGTQDEARATEAVVSRAAVHGVQRDSGVSRCCTRISRPFSRLAQLDAWLERLDAASAGCARYRDRRRSTQCGRSSSASRSPLSSGQARLYAAGAQLCRRAEQLALHARCSTASSRGSRIPPGARSARTSSTTCTCSPTTASRCAACARHAAPVLRAREHTSRTTWTASRSAIWTSRRSPTTT